MSDSHIPDPELFPDWPSYNAGVEVDDLVEVANNPDFSDATEAWFWSGIVESTHDKVEEEGQPTRLINWEHYPVFYSYVRKPHGAYGALQKHRYVRKVEQPDPPFLDIYDYNFGYSPKGAEVVWNPYTSNSRYAGVDPDEEWPQVESEFEVNELVIVSDSQDLSEPILGLYWDSIVDLDYDLEVDQWGVARRTNWRKATFHFTINPETREIQKHKYIRARGQLYITGDFNMRTTATTELRGSAADPLVTKAELYGLLTRLENLLENTTDPAKMLRSLSSFVGDSEELLPRITKLREILNNTDV